MENEGLKRHFSLLTEHFDSKIGSLSEGQSALRETLTTRIDQLEKSMQDEAEETGVLITLD